MAGPLPFAKENLASSTTSRPVTLGLWLAFFVSQYLGLKKNEGDPNDSHWGVRGLTERWGAASPGAPRMCSSRLLNALNKLAEYGDPQSGLQPGLAVLSQAPHLTPLCPHFLALKTSMGTVPISQD